MAANVFGGLYLRAASTIRGRMGLLCPPLPPFPALKGKHQLSIYVSAMVQTGAGASSARCCLLRCLSRCKLWSWGSALLSALLRTSYAVKKIAPCVM